MKTMTLLALIHLLTLSGCVFISEPDVGAPGAGPDFQNEIPDDDSSNIPPGFEDGMAPEPNEGGDGVGAVDERFDDLGLPTDNPDSGASMSPDDASTLDEDTDVLDADAEMIESDAALMDSPDASDPMMPDATGETADADVMPSPDMMVDPPTESCDDIVWDCSSNGYCDPIGRPDCALSPGSPACYPFTNLTQTDPAAYARCCAREGSCMRGNFCEPERLDYCWLLGDGAVCYIRSNPISDYICR